MNHIAHERSMGFENKDDYLQELYASTKAKFPEITLMKLAHLDSFFLENGT